MSEGKRRRPPRPIPIGRPEFGLSNLGARRFDLSDPYYLALSLPWPAFIVTIMACWLAVNLGFALLYVLGPGDLTNARPGSFGDAFFFSIETLATVGYGVMAPATLYGHIVSALEIVTGMAFTAIVTGLLFVRFARPKANFIFSNEAVVTTRNGQPALMLRVANGRTSVMSAANARLFLLMAENTPEGSFFWRIHDLHLTQSHLPLFVVPWTLVHVIDQTSPLHGHDAEWLAASEARLFVAVEARDQALAALVQDMKDYPAAQIRFGMRFADTVMRDDARQTTVDLSRVSLLEPESSGAADGSLFTPEAPACAQSLQPDQPG
ncbi:MAG: inward rectifier potassium channel [Acetobacteraceae bacterium]|nr:inward rectifier potassium channel [Acetobacteraceae bacterium]